MIIRLPYGSYKYDYTSLRNNAFGELNGLGYIQKNYPPEVGKLVADEPNNFDGR
jgi:hypothetical protein